MSQENVDRVNAYMAAYNRRDFAAAVKDFAPNVDFVLPERQAFDSCRGVSQILRFWEGLDETFEDLQLVPRETIDAGDRVATRLRFRSRGKESGAELDQELYHQVITFEDGRMARMDYFETWDEALAAAEAE